MSRYMLTWRELKRRERRERAIAIITNTLAGLLLVILTIGLILATDRALLITGL